jgi:excisionase family DNA binding protein
MDELIDAMEVARIIHLHANSVHRLVSKGKLKSIKIGRRRLFSKREIEKWIEKQNPIRKRKKQKLS